MHFSQIYGCVCSILVLECVWAAPVAEKLNPAMKKRSSSDVLDQEKQLKSLLSLAGNNIPMPNVAVQKSHVAHVETVNGQEVKHEAIEEKVTDTQTGAVVSDIRQDVTENDAPGSAEPQKVVKTKVDIPAEGIHKTIVQNAQKSEVDESLALTPTDVAQYLLETGEFQNFYSAIQDLINSNVMTQEEAEAYQQEVMNEYQRLLAEIDAYQAELAQQQEEAVPVYYPPPFPGQVPQKKSDLYAYQGGFLPEELSPQNQQAIQEALLSNEKSLNEAIDSLLEAWWNQAFEAGDSRAQALVEYLYNIVSKDDDLDDMGQIKEIVAKMLARAVMEDLSVESQPELLENVVDSESSQESEGSDESTEEEAPQQSTSEEESAEEDDKTEESESQEDKVESVEKVSSEVVPPAAAQTEDKSAKM